jgi:ubiquinone/menaquinone biosynthesis C-methylase UbiE
MTRDALDPGLVTSLYDEKSKWYDLQHGLVTLKSDDRGRRMVVDRGVQSGERVLDAGGGTGSTGLRAAAKVGPKGHVVVLDMSQGMLEEAEEKARAAGLVDRMEFVVGDMLELPFDDASFDAVLSTYSVCPLYDPEAGVLELYRVLRPGGRLAVAAATRPPHRLGGPCAGSPTPSRASSGAFPHSAWAAGPWSRSQLSSEPAPSCSPRRPSACRCGRSCSTSSRSRASQSGVPFWRQLSICAPVFALRRTQRNPATAVSTSAFPMQPRCWASISASISAGCTKPSSTRSPVT